MLHASDVKLSDLKSLLIEIYVSLMLWCVLYLASSMYDMVASYMDENSTDNCWIQSNLHLIYKVTECDFDIHEDMDNLISDLVHMRNRIRFCYYLSCVVYGLSELLRQIIRVTNSIIWFHCTYLLFSCLSALFWKITHDGIYYNIKYVYVNCIAVHRHSLLQILFLPRMSMIF